MSRDHSGSFLPPYTELEIVKKNPFASIDQVGVGQLMKIAVEKGRSTRPNLELGICGEHGGDPDSVNFCHQIGLTYVSCSPFRVPVARLAAAQAAIADKKVTAAKPAKKKQRQRGCARESAAEISGALPNAATKSREGDPGNQGGFSTWEAVPIAARDAVSLAGRFSRAGAATSSWRPPAPRIRPE